VKAKIKSILLASGALLFSVCLLTMPTETVEASKRGLELWASSVFPSLLPFFVTGELLIGFGIVHFIGVLFEPVMRPLFNIPGVGGFVWAIGMASGYPAGANFTARMRQEGQLSQVEAERLVAFSNASNPIFIIAVISVSFLKTPSLGFLLAGVHYGSNLLVGLIMRFYQHNQTDYRKKRSVQGIWKRAFNTLHSTRINNNKPFGKLLGDAVVQAVETALMIGGFIIIFSVISTILIETGILILISKMFSAFFLLFQIPPILTLPFSIGIFEITIGAQQIASVLDQSMMIKAMLISALLAFNGLSVHAQVASILANTDIRYHAYLYGRLIQAALATLLILCFYPLLQLKNDLPIGQAIPVQALTSNHLSHLIHFLNQYGMIITISSLSLCMIILLYRLIKQLTRKSMD